MRIAFLTKEEWADIKKERASQAATQRLYEQAKYVYSEEKTKELLAQRDLQKELKCLKRKLITHSVGIMFASLCLSCLAAVGTYQKSHAVRRGASVAVGALTFIALCAEQTRLSVKIRLKKAEIRCAKQGFIDSWIEMQRQRS